MYKTGKYFVCISGASTHLPRLLRQLMQSKCNYKLIMTFIISIDVFHFCCCTFVSEK